MSTRDTLLAILRQSGTIREVQAFLRNRGLPFSSSSWDDLLENRVLPALRLGDLTESDLLALLTELEEFGKQHVFLYRRRGGAVGLPDGRQLSAWLRDKGDLDVVETPRILDQPPQITLADVRRERLGQRDTLTLKYIETRVKTTFIGEEERANNRFVRLYERENVRAVNVVRAHSEGLLEFRAFSHRSHLRSYKEDVDALWALVADLLDPKQYVELSIARAKQTLWDQRAANAGRIRFSDTSLRNDQGSTMSCQTGAGPRSLFDDPSVDEGLTVFQQRSDAFCESHNVWWVSQDGGLPSRDVHVLLSGATNEFAVTQQCTRDDYEHVLADLRRLNR